MAPGFSLVTAGTEICPAQSLPRPLTNCAGHILTTAERRFDLAVAVGALGNLHFAAIVQFQGVINKRRVTFGARRIHTHTAFRAFIGCHGSLLSIVLGELGYSVLPVQ